MLKDKKKFKSNEREELKEEVKKEEDER